MENKPQKKKFRVGDILKRQGNEPSLQSHPSAETSAAADKQTWNSEPKSDRYFPKQPNFYSTDVDTEAYNLNQPDHSSDNKTSFISNKYSYAYESTNTQTSAPPNRFSGAEIGKVDLRQDEEEESFDIFRYIGILLRRKAIVLAFILIASFFSFTSYLTSPRYYITNARILFSPWRQQIIENSDNFIYLRNYDRKLNTHLELIGSDEVLKKVAQKFNYRISASAIKAGLSIRVGETNGERNDILELSFKNADSSLAREVINEICATYLSYIKEIEDADITNLIAKMETQISKIQAELNSKEEALQKFKETNKMTKLSSEANIVVTKLSNMEVAFQQTNLSLMDAGERLRALEAQIDKQEIDIIQSMTYDDPFQSKIASLELELNAISGEYSPEHFKVRMLKQQIEELKNTTRSSITKEATQKTLVKNPIRQSLLQEYINTTVEKAALEAKSKIQQQLIEQLNEEMARLPAIEKEFAQLSRETESMLQIVTMLKTRYQEAKIRRDSRESDLKLLELAQSAQGPFASKSMRNVLMGILVGLILGMGLAFIVEYLDQSIKDPHDVEKHLELPILGVVPMMNKENQLIEKDAEKGKVALEPFRALRANIKHLAANGKIKVLIVSSAVKGEGKTTLASNLAIAFAMDGKKVILVDADLRRSLVHSLFKISKELGLSDYLQGTAGLEQIVKSSGYENLSIVTSGERPNNPAELLGTQMFQKFVDEVKKEADIVIFDSPALLPVSDTISMAPKMDAVLMVARALWSPMKAVKQARNQLQRINSSIIGVVFNGIATGLGYYPYFYYGYYNYAYAYKYSYENDDKPRRFSIRKSGLKIESKLKEHLNNIHLSIPRYISMLGNYARSLSFDIFLWVLLLIFLSLSIIVLVLKSRSSETSPYEIKYLGNPKLSSGSAAAGSANHSVLSEGMPLEYASEVFADPAQAANINPNIIDTSARDSLNTTEAEFLLRDSINSWIQALNRRDFAKFLSFYDSLKFNFSGGTYNEWVKAQRSEFSKKQRYFYKLDTLWQISREPSGTKMVVVVAKMVNNNIIVEKRQYQLIWQQNLLGHWKIVNQLLIE